MALETTNYQCPACGGPLRYDGAAGKLVCDYCDSQFEVAEVEKMYAAEQAKADAAAVTADEFDASVTDEGMKVYTCPSCGAELVANEATAVTQCPYCGNPTVVPGALKDEFKPDMVIPFKLGRKAAEDALKRHYEGKKFLPKAFAGDNKIKEVQGVYVPFWLYGAHVTGEARYEATNVRVYRRGKEEITETDYYDVYRAGELDFERVPVDGSTRMPDTHMDAIEPFDYGDLVPYSVAYLPGFLADRYDQTSEECLPRAERRMETSFENELDGTLGSYDTHMRLSGDTQVECGEAAYALMPVWMLSTRWNDENFLFAMNGQTGKLIGNLPVDRGKVAAWFVGLFAIFGVVLAAAFVGLGIFEKNGTGVQIGAALLVGAVISGLVCASFYSQMKTAHIKTQADDYEAGAGLALTDREDRFRTTVRTVVTIEDDDKD